MRKSNIIYLFLSCFICGIITIAAAINGSKLSTVVYERALEKNSICIVIDPGHGGEDGGAISCTGVYESMINLQISKRLNDLFHLLGFKTKLLRTEDTALYLSGDSLNAKKISDLKERVRMVEEENSSIFISIHQNKFSDPQYSGAQVFYRKGSENFAKMMQNTIVSNLNEGSNRKCKLSKEVYILDHISCPGILIECGFLSNITEEQKLRDPVYQKKLCSVIAGVTSQYLSKCFLDQVNLS